MVIDVVIYEYTTDDTSDNGEVLGDEVFQHRYAGTSGPALSFVTATKSAAIDSKLITSYWSRTHQCFVCGFVTQIKMRRHVLKTHLTRYCEQHTTYLSCEVQKVQPSSLAQRHIMEHGVERTVLAICIFGASLCWAQFIKLKLG